MIYIDTSALVPIFVREIASDSMLDWLDENDEPLALSEWVLTEFSSAVHVKVRMGALAETIARRATVRCERFARSNCTVFIPQSEDFRRAAQLCAKPGLKLRAGDALHLAIVEGSLVKTLLSLDLTLCESARGLKIDVVMP